MKKTKLLIPLAVAGIVLSACSGPNAPTNDDGFAFKDAPENSIKEINGLKSLVNGSIYLSFPKVDDKYSIALNDLKNNTLISQSENPFNIRVRGKSTGLMGGYKEKVYSEKYLTVTERNYGYQAYGEIKTDAGTVFKVHDSYYISDEQGITVNRNVITTEANAKDAGFASFFTISDASASRNVDDFEYFIPSILYKDTTNMPMHAIGSNLYLDAVYVKETRTGLPMAMIRNKTSGYYTSISHNEPKVSVNGRIGGGGPGEISNDLQYAGIGFSMAPLSVDFIYPCSEGPATYDAGSTWARRYHEVKNDTKHTYQVCINSKHTDTFNSALVDSYRTAYNHIDSTYKTLDNKECYDQNIFLFNDTYKEFGTGQVKAAGVPWSINLNTGEITLYTFQMGFVGQQTSVGYNMWRTGVLTKNEELIRRGDAILKFWCSRTINQTYFPHVWWDPADNISAGQTRGYASYLRCMVDGMEGILDAYIFAQSQDIDKPEWINTVLRFATNLANKQNADGSFNRAYTTNGDVAINPADKCLQGESKLNTPIAIRFYQKLYQLTNDNKFKDIAVKAAEFCYTELYEKLGKYVGGTPDNANVCDKEAAIYATFGFRSAYELTKDEKFKDAMLHAAVTALSWCYVYDFASPATGDDVRVNPFQEEGRTIGFSIIATGHSGADNYISVLWYDYFKIFELTKDEFFLSAAKLVCNAGKLNTDYDGKLGYRYRAMMPEATNISDFNFGSCGVWLPWTGIVNIQPIDRFYDDYGFYNIDEYLDTIKEA